jgi:hypothetical protein
MAHQYSILQQYNDLWFVKYKLHDMVEKIHGCNREYEYIVCVTEVIL